MKGRLRLINDSKYDVKSIDILIEHFDSEGISVNTDHEKIYKIIRSGGYLEFDWYSSDCSSCETQEFQISFTKEY